MLSVLYSGQYTRIFNIVVICHGDCLVCYTECIMNMRERAGERNAIGAQGELIARKWLKNKGFSIIADNWQCRQGEIDIIAKKSTVIHFVEVKTLSFDSKAALERSLAGMSWRPEELVHEQKVYTLQRISELWLLENQWTGEWQLDVAAVRLLSREKFATVDIIENIIL